MTVSRKRILNENKKYLKKSEKMIKNLLNKSNNKSELSKGKKRILNENKKYLKRVNKLLSNYYTSKK
jgi:hypothetical protein